MNLSRRLTDTHIALAHGNGGRLMRELIESLFAHHLGNELLDTHVDAARLPVRLDDDELMVTTDGFTVDPLEFPGGNIGSLAVHGTVNDLAVSGATPLYLTLSALIEEGLEIAVLDRVLESMAQACKDSHVSVVAGDTKVLKRGQGGGIYFAVTGIGRRTSSLKLGMDMICPGDAILLSGSVGDHGTAVLLAREQFGLSGDLKSDSASVLPITQTLMDIPGLRFMRDPTRGGLATVAYEIAHATDTTVRLKEAHIPILDPVRTVCDMLGYDPLYLASEGRVVAVIDTASAELALSKLHALGYADANIVGTIASGRSQVVLETDIGGERILEELEDDPLPRIC
ncbi:hydrogenase expression/formation protein HypE [Methylomonas sp. 11b]|uniref:hydrogenase expression/formation protein HypE n=1 Tax=Methylomonas sp. 11b TaxID=1168169 RepID=UPI00047B30AC|nr:hydrogenase expression/formation protein HypE [Methylomonas sp. 11b]